MVHGHYTKYEWNSATDMQDITQILKKYSHKIYFTCIEPLLLLITVPNMYKINSFFTAISQQTQNLRKNCHNYSNLAHSQILLYVLYKINPASHHGGMHEDGWTRSYIPQFGYSLYQIRNNPVMWSIHHNKYVKLRRKTSIITIFWPFTCTKTPLQLSTVQHWNKIYKNVKTRQITSIITRFGHTTKLCFTDIKLPLYLFIVPNLKRLCQGISALW